MFGDVLQRVVRRQRDDRLGYTAFAGLACAMLWIHPLLMQWAFPEPAAVVAPRLLDTAEVAPRVFQPPPRSHCGADDPRSVVAAAYTPGPPVEELNATKTGRTTRRSGRVRIRQCFNEKGRVEHAEIVGHFRGDPEIDAIVLRTVLGWRMNPEVFTVPRECRLVDFAIEFE